MRQTIQEIQVNVAYRWFLGLSLTDSVPHFSTFGKNYKWRFEGTSIAQQIFSQILTQCLEAGVVDTQAVFMDVLTSKLVRMAGNIPTKKCRYKPNGWQMKCWKLFKQIG